MVRVRAGSLLVIAALAILVGGSSAAVADPPKPRFPILDNDEAWQRLPRENPPLPAWARVLASSLPRTTAAMLKLDSLHRVKNPLGPVLSGKLRWVAADANGCSYAKRYAEADLRRAGLADDDLKKLAGNERHLPEAEHAVLAFARKLTLAAHTVTDEEVVELIDRFGAEKVVAIVHTLAYANFQQRILLALGIDVESGGPLPPLEVAFDLEGKQKLRVPSRPSWKEVRGPDAPVAALGPDWQEQSFADLQKALDQQKARKSRIPLPDQRTLAKLAPDVKKRASRIVWSNVSIGYQPALTRAWFNCMSAFQKEAQLDRVFSNTMFWVVTRSAECIY
jgi:alkylhydroperoxidase family enzyme